MKKKPIIVLDFDGVIHGYQSGWKGAAIIPDPPVPGALEFIVTALDHFEVNILSSHSHQWGGRRAMKKWLFDRLLKEFQYPYNSELPGWWVHRVDRTAFADPWPEECWWAAKLVIKEIRWPIFKPPALITIDDRAIQFTGAFPDIAEIRAFRPWNKR